MEAAPAADERGQFEIWRYGSEDPIDLMPRGSNFRGARHPHKKR